MPLENPHFAPAARLARALADGEISSVELLDHFAARYRDLNGDINAVINVDFDAARAKAVEADAARARGESWGPLHGLPITVKDSFETADFVTTSGAPMFKNHRPERNADAVQRYVDAGAIIFGKTNLPYLAMDMQSYNPLFGTTNNPWDLSRTPGGSSGGAAAALAAGLTGWDIGSDIGGSLRTPAHYSGVYAHKPSYGIISQRGHVPPAPGTKGHTDLNVIGPMGRAVEDLELGLELLAGPDEINGAWSLTLPPPRRTTLEDFRVAYWFADEACALERNYGAVLEDFASALEDAGARLTARWPLEMRFEQLYTLYADLLKAAISLGASERRFNAARAMRPFMKSFGTHHPMSSGGMILGSTIRHRDWLRLDEARHQLRYEIRTFFEEFDVLLLPVTPWPAHPHLQTGEVYERRMIIDGVERRYSDALMWISLATALYLPATVIPIGRTAAGLPVGVQIVGPYLEDKTTLAFAETAQAITGGFVPPPLAAVPK